MLSPADIMVWGGWGTWIATFFGIIILFLILIGIILAFTAGRKKPDGALMKTWAVVILALGFLCGLAGLMGTITGLSNVFENIMDVPPGEMGYWLATGIYEANFNVIVGFFFALVSLFGWAFVRTILRRG
ncbi:MAG: MotA/TolQ/ExbB proton channel family protein [Candidatus Coatesbacteria bacterium]|nr:MAG: MotA/TolQ/ExbB proton channel family protein [Candidatus Coatesbacteria bacterium]